MRKILAAIVLTAALSPTAVAWEEPRIPYVIYETRGYLDLSKRDLRMADPETPAQILQTLMNFEITRKVKVLGWRVQTTTWPTYPKVLGIWVDLDRFPPLPIRE